MNYTSTFVCNGFSLALWSRLTGWSAKTYEKWSFLGIFSRLSSFPQVFGQVKEWFILELLEMMKAPHVVACSIIFMFLWSRLKGRSAQTYKKWSFFSIFSCLDPFSQGFDQVKKYLMLEIQKIIRLSPAVASLICFYFVLRSKLRSVQSFEKW